MRILQSLIATVLLVLLGCSGAEVASTPEKDYPEARYLRATGLGQSEGEARNQAVAELSRVFQSRVRSDTLDRVKVVATISEDRAEETTEQRLRSRIRVMSDVELTGVELAGTWQEGATHYALAVLERRTARDQWLREMEALDQEIAGMLRSARDEPSLLVRYRIFMEAIDLWLSREVLAGRVRVLGFADTGSSAYDMGWVFQAIPALKSRMLVLIDVEGGDAALLTDRLSEDLGRAGFVITEEPGEAVVAVRGSIVVEPVEIDHPDWVYARARVSLSVDDLREGVSIGEVVADERSSHLTYEEASKRAVRRAMEEIWRRLREVLVFSRQETVS
jgi:hypothetical protein